MKEELKKIKLLINILIRSKHTINFLSNNGFNHFFHKLYDIYLQYTNCCETNKTIHRIIYDEIYQIFLGSVTDQNIFSFGNYLKAFSSFFSSYKSSVLSIPFMKNGKIETISHIQLQIDHSFISIQNSLQTFFHQNRHPFIGQLNQFFIELKHQPEYDNDRYFFDFSVIISYREYFLYCIILFIPENSQYLAYLHDSKGWIMIDDDFVDSVDISFIHNFPDEKKNKIIFLGYIDDLFNVISLRPKNFKRIKTSKKSNSLVDKSQLLSQTLGNNNIPRKIKSPLSNKTFSKSQKLHSYSLNFGSVLFQNSKHINLIEQKEDGKFAQTNHDIQLNFLLFRPDYMSTIIFQTVKSPDINSALATLNNFVRKQTNYSYFFRYDDSLIYKHKYPSINTKIQSSINVLSVENTFSQLFQIYMNNSDKSIELTFVSDEDNEEMPNFRYKMTFHKNQFVYDLKKYFWNVLFLCNNTINPDNYELNLYIPTKTSKLFLNDQNIAQLPSKVITFTLKLLSKQNIQSISNSLITTISFPEEESLNDNYDEFNSPLMYVNQSTFKIQANYFNLTLHSTLMDLLPNSYQFYFFFCIVSDKIKEIKPDEEIFPILNSNISIYYQIKKIKHGYYYNDIIITAQRESINFILHRHIKSETSRQALEADLKNYFNIKSGRIHYKNNVGKFVHCPDYSRICDLPGSKIFFDVSLEDAQHIKSLISIK